MNILLSITGQDFDNGRVCLPIYSTFTYTADLFLQYDEETDEEKELAHVPVPSVCPVEDCNDRIISVDRQLRVLFKEFQDTVRSHGPESGVVARKEINICIYIKSQRMRSKCREDAQKNGWPIDTDFKHLPDRVLPMKEELRHLLFIEGIYSKNPILRQFIKDVERKTSSTGENALKKLMSQTLIKTPGDEFMNSRPG